MQSRLVVLMLVSLFIVVTLRSYGDVDDNGQRAGSTESITIADDPAAINVVAMNRLHRRFACLCVQPGIEVHYACSTWTTRGRGRYAPLNCQ